MPNYKKVIYNNISLTAVCATTKKKIRSFNSESEMINVHTLRTM